MKLEDVAKYFEDDFTLIEFDEIKDNLVIETYKSDNFILGSDGSTINPESMGDEFYREVLRSNFKIIVGDEEKSFLPKDLQTPSGASPKRNQKSKIDARLQKCLTMSGEELDNFKKSYNQYVNSPSDLLIKMINVGGNISIIPFEELNSRSVLLQRKNDEILIVSSCVFNGIQEVSSRATKEVEIKTQIVSKLTDQGIKIVPVLAIGGDDKKELLKYMNLAGVVFFDQLIDSIKNKKSKPLKEDLQAAYKQNPHALTISLKNIRIDGEIKNRLELLLLKIKCISSLAKSVPEFDKDVNGKTAVASVIEKEFDLWKNKLEKAFNNKDECKILAKQFWEKEKLEQESHAKLFARVVSEYMSAMLELGARLGELIDKNEEVLKHLHGEGAFLTRSKDLCGNFARARLAQIYGKFYEFGEDCNNKLIAITKDSETTETTENATAIQEAENENIVDQWDFNLTPRQQTRILSARNFMDQIVSYKAEDRRRHGFFALMKILWEKLANAFSRSSSNNIDDGQPEENQSISNNIDDGQSEEKESMGVDQRQQAAKTASILQNNYFAVLNNQPSKPESKDVDPVSFSQYKM